MVTPAPAISSGRELLRHALATIAYRGGKALRDAPPEFAEMKISDTTRTPVQILAHIGDLFDWALWLSRGEHRWNDSQPLPWPQEVDRFFASLTAFDVELASDKALAVAPEKLLQGPIADALTHIGQLALLRRLAGVPVRGENYYKADIQTGRVGPQQAAPKREFD